MNDTTKRYKANSEVLLDEYKLKNSDLYQFGCELEFYIDEEKYNYLEVAEILTQEISTFCDVDILVDLTNLPIDQDKNNCVQIKPDQSLEDHGIEISIPITSANGVKYYIEKILPLIEKYGYTNKDTGLHFHISTINKDGANFNFYLYMLMCHDKELLSSWQPRIGYSQNVMDILSCNTKVLSREIKNSKGTIWNLEKLESNHIEIKSIGGKDYHKEIDRIFEEFDKYVECFDCVFKNRETKYIEKLKTDHKEQINNSDKERVAQFSSAVTEAGLLPE